jgi:MFS family permease
LLGLSAGGILTATYLLGTSWIPSHSRASGMALLTSGTLLGNALGPVAMGLLVSLGLRVALSTGILVFILLLWVAFTLKPLASSDRY